MVYNQYKKFIDFLSDMKQFFKMILHWMHKRILADKKSQKKKTYAAMPYSGNQVT